MSGRCLVSGAGGFLGRRVVETLVARGDEVVALVRPGGRGASTPCTVFEADLRGDFSTVLGRVGAVDSVIHLAQAPGWGAFPANAGDVAAVAAAATARLAEFAVAQGARSFVYASTGGLYRPAEHPLSEDDPTRSSGALGFYFAAKAAGEALLAPFCERIAVQTLRLFFPYGPEQPDAFLIPRLLGRIGRGEAVTLAEGRGPRMNPIHVDDAAAAVAAASARTAPLLANIAGPDIVTVRDLAEAIGRVCGRAPTFEAATGCPEDLVADTAVMARELGAPTIRLSDGLRDLRLSNQGLT